MLHSIVEFTNSVVFLFFAVGEFQIFIAIIEFHRNGVIFPHFVGVIFEIEEIAVGVSSKQFLDECLCVSGFSDTIRSNEEKKLNSISGLDRIFDVGFEGVDGFLISVNHQIFWLWYKCEISVWFLIFLSRESFMLIENIKIIYKKGRFIEPSLLSILTFTMKQRDNAYVGTHH